MTTRAWEEEDWAPRKPSTSTRPNPAAPAFSPRILHPDSTELYTMGGQPRTTYRPELKILKREPDTPEAPAPAVTSEETDKSRRERERKEKERRYREARERIMGEAASPSPSTPASANGNNSTPKQQQKQRKRSPDANTTPKSKSPSQTPNNSGKHSTNNSRGTTPVPQSRTPSSRSPPPRNSAVTSFKLNGGEFKAAPAVPADGRRSLQKVDEKLLESQLTAKHSQEIVVDRDLEGGVYLSEGGLDWDDFSRETVVPVQQQQSQQWTGYSAGAGEYDYYNNGNNGHYGNGNYGNGNGNYGNGNGNVNGGYNYTSQFPPRQTQNPGVYGAAVGEGRFVYDNPQTPPAPALGGNVRAPGSMQAGVVQALREPRGPDLDGSRGFKGRGSGYARNGYGQGRYT
ncbi:hypothetical protein DFP73DRAFT_203967 [Morchella snyderi]|nr:hypothetical protein DFP73DRAFT_203967 [Morchella snyderi]